MIYRIDYRDSRPNGKGAAVGFCVEVRAESKAEALRKLRDTYALPEEIIERAGDQDDDDDFDLRVYFYPENLTEDDLEDEDEAEKLEEL